MSCCGGMTFDFYQQASREYARYPDVGANFTYPTLGLCGEAGECAEKIKKVLRDKNGVIDDNTRTALAKEIGDVCWYLAQLCSELDMSLGVVAGMNLDKLADRLQRDKINGDGDNR